MTVSLYVLVDLFIIAAPLALSFDRKVMYVRRWPAVFVAMAIVGLLYIAWDSTMAMRGAWRFSDRFAGATRILALPPGELFFFVVVPFSCVFIYEVVAAYAREKSFRVHRAAWIAAGALFLAMGFLAMSRLYTGTVLGAVGAFFLLSAAFAPSLLGSKVFWLSIATSYAPFLVANGILTALPVVTYGEAAILGPRALSIPIEDFLYSFSYLGFTIFTYRLLRDALAFRCSALSTTRGAPRR